VGELGLLLHRTLEFGAVATSLVGGDSEMVVANKVVMVNMTSDGAPMGVAHRLSTGEIIFVSS